MKLMRYAVIAFLLGSICVHADELRIRVQNLANQRPAVNGIASGSLIFIRPEFYSGTRVAVHTYYSLDGISARITPTGAPGSELVLLPGGSWPFGVVALLPADLPLGKAKLTFIENGQTSGPLEIPIVRSSFGLFAGFIEGPAVAQNIDPSGTPSLNRLTNVAHPGQVVTLWGTGLGLESNGVVEVELGGKSLVPLYSGSAPGLPGVDQINIVIPQDLITRGCYVPVTVKAGNMVSNTASIAIADEGSVCLHPFHLSLQDLTALDDGKGLPFSTFTVESTVRGPGDDGRYSRQEYATARFATFDSDAIAGAAGFTTPDEVLPFCRLSYDSSIVSPIRYLDAGEKITFAGPAGKILDLLPPYARGYYISDQSPSAQQVSTTQPPQRYFEPGLWRIVVPGGEDVPAFEDSVILPAEIRWNNQEAWRTINPREDNLVTWSGGSSDSVAVVRLSAMYAIGPSRPNVAIPGGIAAGFTPASDVEVNCVAASSEGQVTIPARLLEPFTTLPLLGDARLTITLQPRTLFVLNGPLGGIANYHLAQSLRVRLQ